MESPWFNENDRLWNIYSRADCRFGVTHQASGSGEVGELALNFVITTGHNALPAKKSLHAQFNKSYSDVYGVTCYFCGNWLPGV